MKSLAKTVLSFSLFGILCVAPGINEAQANEKYLTVTFKPEVSEKYVRVLNLMTGTELAGKISGNIYKLKMVYEKNPEAIRQYSQLFSLIPEVINITDSSQNNLTLKGFSEKKKSRAGDIVQGVILVKFKKWAKLSDIKILANKYKTKAELIASALNLYKIKLPVSLSVESAISLFKQSEIVEYAEADRVMTIQKNKSPKGGPVNKGNTDKPALKTNSTGLNVISPALNLTFRPDSEELAVNLFNLVYDTKLTGQSSPNTYLFNLPGNINPDNALQAFKLCPYLLDIKIFQRNN